MKILVLSAYCYPEQVASSQGNNDTSEANDKAGIQRLVITPRPTRGIDEATYRKYKKIKREERGLATIIRFPMIREGSNPLQRAFRYCLCWCMHLFYGLKKAKECDLVYCASTPPIQGALGAIIKMRHQIPFLYELQDIFPDSLVSAGFAKKGGLLWKIGRAIEDFTYRNADKIIVISEDFKRNIMAKDVPEDKIVVIPNWSDTQGVYPVDRKDNVLFDRYHLDRSKFYICYSGNIGYTQNMDLLLDTAQDIQNELTEVRFVIIGEGAAKADVERRIKDEGIDNVTLLSFQPAYELAQVFCLGDVGLIISKQGVGGSSVPSKTWNIMAAERPILASFDRDSQLASLVEHLGCGMVAEAGNKEELINAIRQLASDSHLSEMGRRGKEYLVTELGKDKCVNKYIETIKRCILVR